MLLASNCHTMYNHHYSLWRAHYLFAQILIIIVSQTIFRCTVIEGQIIKFHSFIYFKFTFTKYTLSYDQLCQVCMYQNRLIMCFGH